MKNMKKKLFEKLGFESFLKFSKLQKLLTIANNIEIFISAWIMTGIGINLTVDGVITSNIKSLGIIFPAFGAIILKKPYEKYKNIIIPNLSKLLKLDIIISLLTTVMLFSNDMWIQKIGYIIVTILFGSTFQTIISYSYVDLKGIFFKDLKDEQEYTKSDNQIKSVAKLFGYSLSIFIAPYLPIFMQMLLLMLSNCAGSITMLYVLHITDTTPALEDKNKIKV